VSWNRPIKACLEVNNDDDDDLFYATQNDWIFGLCPVHCPIFEKLGNTEFQKLDLFPSSG
jgi:hypothetical protein